MINTYRSRKKTIIFIVAIILVWTIWHFIKNHKNSASPFQDAVVVEVSKVKQGGMPVEAQAVGTLVAAKSVEVTPEVAGQVAEVLAYDGKFVTAGTPIVKLDATVNKAKAESAQANFVYSSANYKRMQELGKKGAISQQAIEQALADFQDKKAKAEESRVLAEKMTLTAPFNGVLGKIKVNPGEYVEVGHQVVTLTDIKNLRVEFSVSEKFLGKLKVGQQVILKTTAYPDKEFYGKVAYIAPTINTQDRTIAMYADVPNEDGKLAAGLFVNVMQTMDQQTNLLLVPAESLVATIDGQQVFKVVKDKAVATPVKIGLRSEKQVQILEGLAADDVIVTMGQHKLRDGALIKIGAA